MRTPPALAFALLLGLAACAAPRERPAGPAEQPTFRETGLASWYGRAHQGRPTAAGERFDMRDMTAAHRSLPFDTVARVTNLETHATAKVRINDRGPHVRGRIIDLSAAAARALGLAEDGVARVLVEVYPSDQGGHAAAEAQ
jgi:rare lipoprotein A